MPINGWMYKQTGAIHIMKKYRAIRKNDLLVHTTTWNNFKILTYAEKKKTSMLTMYNFIYIKIREKTNSSKVTK